MRCECDNRNSPHCPRCSRVRAEEALAEEREAHRALREAVSAVCSFDSTDCRADFQAAMGKMCDLLIHGSPNSITRGVSRLLYKPKRLG